MGKKSTGKKNKRVCGPYMEELTQIANSLPLIEDKRAPIRTWKVISMGEAKKRPDCREYLIKNAYKLKMMTDIRISTITGYKKIDHLGIIMRIFASDGIEKVLSYQKAVLKNFKIS